MCLGANKLTTEIWNLLFFESKVVNRRCIITDLTYFKPLWNVYKLEYSVFRVKLLYLILKIQYVNNKIRIIKDIHINKVTNRYNKFVKWFVMIILIRFSFRIKASNEEYNPR